MRAEALAGALALHLALAGALLAWPKAVVTPEEPVIAVVFLPAPPVPVPVEAVAPPPGPVPVRAVKRATIARPATPDSPTATATATAAAAAVPSAPALAAPVITEISASAEPAGRAEARLIEAPRPHYPRAARQRGWEGVVVLAVTVDAEGQPAQVAVKLSSGIGVLDAAAEQAVRRWRFSPATEGGRPVIAAVEVPVRFSLAES